MQILHCTRLFKYSVSTYDEWLLCWTEQVWNMSIIPESCVRLWKEKAWLDLVFEGLPISFPCFIFLHGTYHILIERICFFCFLSAVTRI